MIDFNPNLFPILRNLTIFFAAVMLFKYFVFLVLAPFHTIKEQLRELKLLKLSRQGKGDHRHYQPLVSVIIPAWNEEVGVIKTLESALRNTYKRIEILVVNDGSTDKTHDTVSNFIALKAGFNDTGQKIRYLNKENGGKGTALNHGIAAANGEIIMTVDADSILDKRAIQNLVRYFADSSIDAAVGNVKVANTNNLAGLLQNLEYTFGFYFKRAHSVLDSEYIFGGACAAFRRTKIFNNLGLFDTSNKTEDIELSVRIRFHGLHNVFAEDVWCYTEGASDFTSLINQRLRWKKGRFDTFIKYRRLFFSLDRRHNRFLSWFILPYAIFQEIQLLFEPVGIALLVTYSIISGDFVSLALGISFIFVSYLVAALFNHRKASWKVILLFPFTWPLFYLLMWVEYLALVKSLLMVLRGDEIVWQGWKRKGIEANETL
ncbi:MAG: glycosyltransferase [Patescibacteria group bacterium]